MEFVVAYEMAEKIIEVVKDAAATGKAGDGRISAAPIQTTSVPGLNWLTVQFGVQAQKSTCSTLRNLVIPAEYLR